MHLEVCNSMETDSFTQVLRRLIGRRGNIQTIRFDNGSNFVGAEKQLLKAFKDIQHNKIKFFLQNNCSDWLVWHRNPSAASHIVGTWERQIRSTTKILAALIKTHGRSLGDEALRTLRVEVETVVNSRSLTVDTISDADSQIPISLSNILTIKSNVVMPPPGNFEKLDLHCRKRWCRVQDITNEFCSRWKKEFLVTLQSRAKWKVYPEIFRLGMLFCYEMIKHETNVSWPESLKRNQTSMEFFSVKLKVAGSKLNETLRRLISKLVLLVSSNNSNDTL